MLTFPAPNPIHGDTLESALAEAGFLAEVHLDGDTLCVVGPDDADHDAVAAVVNEHPPLARAALDATTRAATNESTVTERAAAALQANLNDISTNDAFLASASPTNAQVVAQVRELTRQSTRQAREMNALIRLTLRRFEDVT